MGGLATINRLAPRRPARRDDLQLPRGVLRRHRRTVIGVGFAAESLGLYGAALTFAIAIGALTLVAEAIAFTGPTRACLGRGLPCSDGWLAAHNLWRGC
jgi:hypothetical protein